MIKYIEITGNGRYNAEEEAEWPCTEDLTYYILQQSTFYFMDESHELVEDWEVRHNHHEGWNIICYDARIEVHFDYMVEVVGYIKNILIERGF